MDPYRCYAREPSAGRSEVFHRPYSLEGLGYANASAVEDEIHRLFARYGSVLFSVRHTAPCSAWRAERAQLSDNEEFPRFANRVHVFQTQREPPDDEQERRSYQADDPGEYGRYLGYVSLRPASSRTHELPGVSPGDSGEPRSSIPFQYVAVAQIAPPRRMLRARYHVITCAGGASDGVLPFRSAPYCVPSEYPLPVGKLQANRAYCLYAALHQALLLKTTSFSSPVLCGLDMVALLWRRDPRPETLSSLYDHGASLQEALDLLRSDQVGAGGITEDFVVPPAGPERERALLEIHRCITDYLANGIPVIIALRPGDGLQHAMLILGMHLLHGGDELSYQPNEHLAEPRVDVEELPGRFVVHDSWRGPFYEVSARTLLELAAFPATDGSASDTNKTASLLVVAPTGTRIGISTVRRLSYHAWRWDASRSPGIIASYVADHAPPGVSSKMRQKVSRELRMRPRFVTRLLDGPQVQQRYCSLWDEAKGRFALNRRAADTIAGADRGQPAASAGAFWLCVETYAPWGLEGRSSGVTSVPSADNRVPPVAVYLWRAGDEGWMQPRVALRYVGAAGEDGRGTTVELCVNGAPGPDGVVETEERIVYAYNLRSS